MSDYKMIDYGNIYEAILADNRQMRARVVELEAELVAAIVLFSRTSAENSENRGTIARLEADDDE